jgi:phosphoribosyl 1,2-cyclic phosphate phosphodiesterase
VAREEGGKSFRTRTSVSVYLGQDGPSSVRYKVDLGPDTAYHAIRFGESLANLEHLLYTHAHPDHVVPYWLDVRAETMSGTESLTPLHVWANQNVFSYIEQIMPVDFEACRIVPHVVEPFTRFQAGELDVFCLMGRHPETCPSLNFAVTADQKTALFAWDTGIWPEQTWEALRGRCFDAVIMECTVNGPDGLSQGENHHTVESFLHVKKRMEAECLLTPGAPFVTTHMGENGQFSHSEAEEYWAPHGVTVGYDGILVEP